MAGRGGGRRRAYSDHPAVPYDELAAEVVSEVRLLKAIQGELATHATAREQHYRKVDPGQLARSLLGFAEIGAPVLVAIMGRPGRFRDGTRFKSDAGLAPQASETGDTDRKGPTDEQGRALGAAGHPVPRCRHRPQARPQLARIYFLQMTERGATHLKACCVVAGHLAERAWTGVTPRDPVRDLRQRRQPCHGSGIQEGHCREVDRSRGRPQTAAQPQDGGERPAGGHNRAAPARRPSRPRSSRPAPRRSSPSPDTSPRWSQPPGPGPAARRPGSGRPPGRGGGRDLEPFRGPAQRPAFVGDASGQVQPPGLRQRDITVDHEDLPGSGADCGDPHRTRGSSSIQDHPPVSPSPTSTGRTQNRS